MLILPVHFRVPSCSESGQSSNDYQDALDIPYQRLEEFADVLASKVLINSVAISRRETVCSLRVGFMVTTVISKYSQTCLELSVKGSTAETAA